MILFPMNASERNIHKHGKGEETLNWTGKHGRERGLKPNNAVLWQCQSYTPSVYGVFIFQK